MTKQYEYKSSLDAVICIFGLQVLMFPLLVVFLACVSFLFGGWCAAWQWWAAVGAVVGVPFLKKGGWRVALGAAGLFAGVLVAVKGLLPPVFWDNAAWVVDMKAYHLPQIQLLVEGWNPVTDPLAEDITAKLGLDMWGMAPLHVAFLPKTMAVFSAVAYKFVGNPTGLTIPGLAFLWLGVALQAVRMFRGVTRWVAVCALVWIVPIVYLGMFVDLSLAFASCGLLLTMANDLKQRRCDWLHLIVWTTWMATIKLNGLLGAFVFCCFYAGATIWRDRSQWRRYLFRFALFGTTVGALSGVISWHPYGTSWRTYGHPLYPFKSSDAVRFPPQDLTWDIRVVNEDYKALNKATLWTYQFIAPELVKAVGRWTIGKPDFQPRSAWFKGLHYVTWKTRPWLWILFAVLLLHPRGRLWGVAALILTFATPWEKMGFLRYEPWLSALGCLALVLLAESLSAKCNRWQERFLLFGVLLLLAGWTGMWLWQHARDVEFQKVECNLARERVRCGFWSKIREPDEFVDPSDFCPRYNCATTMENHARLLLKEMGRSNTTQLLTAGGWQPSNAQLQARRRSMWKWDERQWFAPEAGKDMRCLEDLGAPWFEGNVWDGFDGSTGAEPWVATPWQLYLVPWGDHTEHLWEYYRGGEPLPDEMRAAWLWRRMKFVAKAWCRTYPEEVWGCLIGSRVFHALPGKKEGRMV